MTKETLKTIILIFLTSLLLFGYVNDDETKQPAKKEKNLELTEDIRLYSNGKLIGQWTGIGRGRMDGNTYVFKTERGAFSDEMRIKGDFVIETSNR